MKNTEREVYSLEQNNVVKKRYGIFVEERFYERHGKSYRLVDRALRIFKTHREAKEASGAVKRMKMFSASRGFGAPAIKEHLVFRQKLENGYEYSVYDSTGEIFYGRRYSKPTDYYPTRLAATRGAVKHLRAEARRLKAQLGKTLAQIEQLRVLKP
jgi:hypothetical protein